VTIGPREVGVLSLVKKYRVSGVILICVVVAAVWLVVENRPDVDEGQPEELERLFGYPEVDVHEPGTNTGEVRGKIALGPRYFEVTKERLEALGSDQRAAIEEHPRVSFLVAVDPSVEEVSIEQDDERITVTTWRTCDDENRGLCAGVGDWTSADSTVSVLPVSLVGGMDDRAVVDGATGKRIAPFAGPGR
jgi:hypothetical protein